MSTTRGTTKKLLVTGIAYLDTREINPNVIDVAQETGFDDLMRVTGREKKTEQPNYHHFVNEDLHQVLTFDTGGVSGSGTATLTVTITGTGYARRDQKYKFANGKVGYINSAITTGSSKDSFTIKSVDGSNLTAADGDKISPLSIINGEGGSEVDALNYGLTKYFNLIEKMKDKTKITDIQKMSKVEVGTGYEAYRQAINQAQSFKQMISATMIAGVKSTSEFGVSANTILDQNSNVMQTTGGLDQEITTYGVNDTVATPGTVLMSDTDDLYDQLTAVKSPSDYLLLSPDAAWRKYSDMQKNLNSSGVESAQLQMDGQTVNYNVEKWQKGRYRFNMGELRILDHPQIFNFSGGSTISKTIYGMPTDKVKVQTGPGSSEVRVGIRYMANPQIGNGEGTNTIREWYTGSLAPTPTSGEDALVINYSTYQGLEALGTRQMFKQRVLA